MQGEQNEKNTFFMVIIILGLSNIYSQKVHVFALVASVQENGDRKISTRIDLKKNNANGPIISNAVVKVNNKIIPYNNTWNGYLDELGTTVPVSVPIHITLASGNTIRGRIIAKSYVRITSPKSYDVISTQASRRVMWRFRDGRVYNSTFFLYKEPNLLHTQSIGGALFLSGQVSDFTSPHFQWRLHQFTCQVRVDRNRQI